MEQPGDTIITEQADETVITEQVDNSINTEVPDDTVIREQAAEIERLLEAMELIDEQFDMIQNVTVDMLSALRISDRDELVNEIRKLCCDILTTIRNG